MVILIVEYSWGWVWLVSGLQWNTYYKILMLVCVCEGVREREHPIRPHFESTTGIPTVFPWSNLFNAEKGSNRYHKSLVWPGLELNHDLLHTRWALYQWTAWCSLIVFMTRQVTVVIYEGSRNVWKVYSISYNMFAEHKFHIGKSTGCWFYTKTTLYAWRIEFVVEWKL